MRNIKGILAYDGGAYNGWQRQGNTRNTIQEKVEQMFCKLLEEQIEIHGAGRTDAGVHAKGQVFHFHTESSMPVSDMCQKANAYLPRDMAVLELQEVNERFHSRLNARWKWYRYIIDNGAVRDVFSRKYAYQILEELNLEKIQKAAQNLCGTHDYRSFCSLKRMKKSTVRTVYTIEAVREDGKIYLDFYGDGFLYNMVRILAGTLIETGLGKREPEEMAAVLEGKKRELAGFTAPAQGLCLMEVGYGTERDYNIIYR
ncbi:MAG: tRNA pseudouridine(38-40) synthase TruA [Lachnospiraceae bacterium]|nr:tRNA pseudouridine(38-40) synthase TruA [Lachnospiraceae bacterium]